MYLRVIEFHFIYRVIAKSVRARTKIDVEEKKKTENTMVMKTKKNAS